MSDARKLILVSRRAEDLKFFEPMARYLKFSFVQAQSHVDLLEALISSQGALVLWDIAEEGNLDPENPLALSAVGSTLQEYVPPSLVFALSDKTVSHYPETTAALAAFPRLFQHNILRRYDIGGLKLIARILLKMLAPAPRGITEYFPADARSQKITLRKAEHRFAAVGAIENFIKRLNGDDRIASKVAQATDELLMNAIFDAATDPYGKRTRTLLDRKAKFDFNPQELVELEFAATEEYLGICVTDFFGSLSIDALMSSAGQNFASRDYKPRKTGPGAGLGIYGMVESGISLMIVCEPRKRTDAMIFFPRTKSYKAFKAGFRLIGGLVLPSKGAKD